MSKENEFLELLREIREEQKRYAKEIMIAQASLDASLASLTTAVAGAAGGGGRPDCGAGRWHARHPGYSSDSVTA